jgi:glycosyltransferase involved in cell wall biosynthesis
MRPILLNWPANVFYGWGILGLNIFWRWAADRSMRPLMGAPIGEDDLAGSDSLRIHVAREAIVASNMFQHELARSGRRNVNFPVVHGLGNGFVGPEGVQGTKNVGRCVFEDTRLAGLDDKLAKYDVLLCASNWNAELLKAHSKKQVGMIFEGVDPSLFHPGPKAGLLDQGRFYIFSGGKVEYRKAHDLVLLAFREFSHRHKDAVLVTAWHSPWPHLSAGFQGRLSYPLELTRDGAIDIKSWVAKNGIDPAAVIELGRTPNPLMPALLREMDCALAVSRAEGCTNLPANEAMACGVPVILAANTGVLDLVGDGNCLPLRRQAPIRNFAGSGTDGWGESDVEEIVEALERLYTDRALRETIGRRGAEWIAGEGRTWAGHAERLKSLVLSL